MKKRILSILLTLCMVLMLVPTTAFAEEPAGIPKGDLNGDGAVNPYDAIFLQNYLEGFENLNDEQLIAADFNGDGEVNYSDWIELQSYLENYLGLPVSNITVTNGKATACGTEISKAASGIRVTLTADSPSDDMVFDKWVVNEGGVTLADASSATTTFTMPADPVSVTATYKLSSTGETGTLAITIDGADVVCAQQDYEFTVTPLAGVTLDETFGYDLGMMGSSVELTIDEDGVGHGVLPAKLFIQAADGFDVIAHGWTADQQFVSGTKHVKVSQEHIYVDGVCGCGAKSEYTITYDGGADFGLWMDVKTHGVDLTLAGKGFYREGLVHTGWMGSDGVFYELGGVYSTDADVTLYPVYDQLITLNVPFTTTVKLGGDAAPGETTFDLALIGSSAGDMDTSDVTVSDSVTTNGAGDYDGELILTGPSQQLWHMLCEGAFVQQVDGGEDGWTYDDTVWGLLLDANPVAYAVSDDAAAAEYTVYVVPTTVDEFGNYGIDWEAIDWENLQSEDMHFTNTYTKSTTEPGTPKTGDNSNFALWLALFAVSAAGVIGTGVYSRRRRSTK